MNGRHGVQASEIRTNGKNAFDREANWTNSSTVTVYSIVTKKKKKEERERTERIEKITIENEVSRGPVSRNF